MTQYHSRNCSLDGGLCVSVYVLHFFFLYIFLIFVVFTENLTHVKMISGTLENNVYSIGLTNESCPCEKTKNTLLSLKWCFWFWLCSINCSLKTIWRVNLISIDRITYSIEATERNGERDVFRRREWGKSG